MQRHKILKYIFPGCIFLLLHSWLYLYTIYARFIYFDLGKHKDFYLLLGACHLLILIFFFAILIFEYLCPIFLKLKYPWNFVYVVTLSNIFDLFAIPHAAEWLHNHGFLSLANALHNTEYESSWFSCYMWMPLLYTYIAAILVGIQIFVYCINKLRKTI